MLTYIKFHLHMNKKYKPPDAKNNMYYVYFFYGGTTTINFIFAMMI